MQKKDVSVDILPSTCVAFAHNSKVYSMIDEFYSTNAEQFYQYAVCHPAYNTCFKENIRVYLNRNSCIRRVKK